MLTALRNSAQSWMIKALLGLIVITFVISFGVGTFSNPKEVLVKIGDNEIMVSQFMTRYQEELERLRQRFPDNADELAAQINLREQVMKDLVNRYLILEAAEREGIMVVEEEVKQAVTQQNAFQVNDKFHFATYRQILQQNRLTPAGYETRLAEDLLVEKHQRTLLAGMILNDNEVGYRFRIENENVEVDYLLVDAARFTPKQPVSDEEAKAYHEKNPETFTSIEQFSLRYFILPLSALESGQKVHPRAVERYYERNVETDFSTPRKVRASHILKRLDKDVKPEDEEKVRAEMAQLAERAKKGEDFAELAKAHSEDFSKDKGGDLGFFAADDMVQAFSSAAFSLAQGQVSGPVRSSFGYHIIKVTGIQDGKLQPLDSVRKVIEAQLLTLQAERKMEQAIARLPGRIEKEGLDEIAAEFKTTAANTGLFDGTGLEKGLGSTGPLHFQLRGKGKGRVGVWKRNPVLGHVFYQITERRPAAVIPFEEVRLGAVAGALQQKQESLALAAARQALEEMKSGADFTAFAKRHRLTKQTTAFPIIAQTIDGIGANPEFQRSAFSLTKEKPFALNIKDGKAYLLRYKRHFYKDPSQEKELKTRIRSRMGNEFAQYITENEVERLRSVVKIDILAPEYLYSGQ